MKNELKRLFLDCWRSRTARAFFLANLLVSMACVGIVWNDPPTLGLRNDAVKLYYVLNWFAIARMGRLFSVIGHPSPSHLLDGILTVVYSVPWWLYGYGSSLAAGKVRRQIELEFPSLNRRDISSQNPPELSGTIDSCFASVRERLLRLRCCR